MSDRSILERLQVKGSRRLAVIGAPAAPDLAIGGPEVRTAPESADVALLFVIDRADLDDRLPSLLSRLQAAAILWIAYPKLTSPLAGDLSRDVIRAAAPTYDLDTVGQIAIDDDWSALRLKRVR